MRVLLIDSNDGRAAIVQQALKDNGYTVVARLPDCGQLSAQVAEDKPDAIIVDTDLPDRDALESMRQVSQDNPRPIVLFTERSDRHTISDAIKAGVSAYVVDGVDPKRLNTIMDVAIAQFREFQAMRSELDEVKAKLADRRDVDKAKGILMQRKGLSEADAYAALRSMAMNNNQSIGEAARSLIAAAQLLV
ncbi:ANTAR domain-containing protein [Granulosicoccaceae sp. 1_MG-2023]|nr:ANTAR domain-containing protein [Granulosicoccaceae sp. 1_MG-2023]